MKTDGFVVAILVIIGINLSWNIALAEEDYPWDVNQDGIVNDADLAIVVNNFGSKNKLADINNDGLVNIIDLVQVSKHFGKYILKSVNMPPNITLQKPVKDSIIDDPTPTFIWKSSDPESNEIYHEFYIDDDADVFSAPMFQKTIGIDTAFHYGDILPSGTYYWGVKAFNMDSGKVITNTEKFSDIWSFTISRTATIPDKPELFLPRSELNFGDSIQKKQLSITNTGTKMLSWYISDSLPGWLSIDPESDPKFPKGGQISPGITKDIFVYVNRQGLDKGTYNYTFTVVSNGGNDPVSVSAVVAQELNAPHLSVSLDSMDFSISGQTRRISITNTGTGILSWNISDDLPRWLSISPREGQISSGNSNDINVSILRTGLATGTYSYPLSIKSNGGNRSVSISMTVSEPAPSLSFSPSSIDFGTKITLMSFTIKNMGGGNLTWIASKQQNSNWLTITPMSGSLTSGNSQIVTLAVNRAGLKPGIYNDVILLDSNGGKGSIMVTMKVE